MVPKRKPGRPPGSLNKATIIKRREAEAEAAPCASAVEAEALVEALAELPSASESSPDVPPTPVPRARLPRKRAEVQSAPEPIAPDVPPTPTPRAPRKRARVIVLDESSSSSEEFTVVRRKKPRRAPQAQEREPEPISVLGGALSTHRQRLDTLKSQYDGFYRHLR